MFVEYSSAKFSDCTCCEGKMNSLVVRNLRTDQFSYFDHSINLEVAKKIFLNIIPVPCWLGWAAAIELTIEISSKTHLFFFTSQVPSAISRLTQNALRLWLAIPVSNTFRIAIRVARNSTPPRAHRQVHNRRGSIEPGRKQPRCHRGWSGQLESCCSK